MNILEVKDLKFSYEKGRNVLDKLNISIRKGSFIALLGANGCGKTTLVQHLNGLIKPSEGQVVFNGVSLDKMKDKDIYSSIGLVFQNPDDQLFCLNVYEDVAYGVKNLGIKVDELNKRVEAALQLLGIYELKDREIHKLSYGQKKRVAIAGVLSMKPKVLILDEPTAGLDPMTVSALMKSLKSIQQKEDVTIIIATHEVDIVPVNCDYVYVLDNGKVVVEGSPVSVFMEKQKIRESRLRLPRIGHLMEIMHDMDDINVDPAAMTISQARKTLKSRIRQTMTGEK